MTALSVTPSKYWLGNDGSWSTFPINVGTPAKTLFMLPSTSGRSIYIVHPEGCEAPGDPSPSDCDVLRGGVFEPNNSTSFGQSGDLSSFYKLDFAPELPLGPALPPNLNYSGASIPGVDDLGLEIQSQTNDSLVLDGQLVAAFAAKVPFLGLIGLSPFNETVSSTGDVNPSLLERLSENGNISSKYWGYNAGAQHRNVFGSLTLGGYDAARGNVDDVLTVPMKQSSNRVLTVQLTNTSVSGVSTGSIDTSIPIFIDSVVPELWLPESIYSLFETNLGLVWNSTVGMYLVDDDHHKQLMNRNASVTFWLAAGAGDQDKTIEITLPYAAFDLTVGYPLLDPTDNSATSRYFPLKRANQTDQYYLGRTFLQEAYIAADFDNVEFHVSQATFTSTTPDIRTVTFPPKKGSLSGGAIAGIVVGAVAAIAIVGGLLWWFCWRKRSSKRSSKRSKRQDTAGTSSIGDDITIAEWNNDVQMHQVEQYKPTEMSGEEVDQYKPELDAIVTARGPPTERHELWGGHVRRVSDQSRASISPLDERHRNNRFSHNRTVSGNSFGQPSPPMSDHPSPPLGTPGRESPFGQPSPRSGSRTPAAAEQDRNWFGAVPIYHELHGRSRDSPRSPTSPVRTPEEVPLSSENVFSQSEQEGRRSGFVEQFDAQARPDSRA